MFRRAAIYIPSLNGEDCRGVGERLADLRAYAQSADLDVVRVFSGGGGTAGDWSTVLEECLDWCCAGGADVLLVPDIVSLGRSAKAILDTVDRLSRSGISVHFQDMGADTLLPSGEEDEYAARLFRMLGLGAQLERKLIMGRLNGGRRRAIDNGVKMGRKPGSCKSRERKEEEYEEVIRLLKNGVSVRETARLCGLSPNTVQSLRKEFLNL